MSRQLTVLIVIAIVVILLIAVFHSPEMRRPTSAKISLEPNTSEARVGPVDIYPRNDLTPGAVDPRVSQGNIESTICVPGYTKTVRPPSSVTRKIKRKLIIEYGLNGSLRDYELDHLIPLELGGCPDCEDNLWPERWEPSPGARDKDEVENYLHRQVCQGKMPLAQAQKAIATDWYRIYETEHLGN